MIVEAVVFNDELELLEARFHEGNDVVDRWIIIESETTFTGRPKPLHYVEAIERFSPWYSRIQHVLARPAATTAWGREREQRDALADALSGIDQDAIVALCDGDELIAAEDWDLIEAMTREGTVCFPQVQHYFTLCWSTPNALPPNGGKMRRSRAARNRDIPPSVGQWADGQYGLELETGWHLSCLGGPERLLRKLQAFSHTELSGPEWANLENCERMIREGIDIDPHRNWPLTRVEPQGPEWLITRGGEAMAVVVGRRFDDAWVISSRSAMEHSQTPWGRLTTTPQWWLIEEQQEVGTWFATTDKGLYVCKIYQWNWDQMDVSEPVRTYDLRPQRNPAHGSARGRDLRGDSGRLRQQLRTSGRRR